MNRGAFSHKVIHFFSDTAWSAAGLILINVVAQFVVYPVWNRRLGSEAYGNIVYQLAVMNTLAIPVGSGVNYARMRKSADGETANHPYALMMLMGTVVALLILVMLRGFGVIELRMSEFVLYCALMMATMWRFYGEVFYRLRLDYKGSFWFFFVIGMGYLLGTWLFSLTGLWPLGLIPGEVAGLLLVQWNNRHYRSERSTENSFEGDAWKLALILVGGNVLSQLIFNSDRIVLRLLGNGTLVSTYYIASLFGKTTTLLATPLTGVLAGYLSKYHGALTRRAMIWLTASVTGTTFAAAVGCIIASHLLLPAMYPTEIDAVRPHIGNACVAQVLYFIGSLLLLSFLLRFSNQKNQLLINAVYGITFLVVCIPATILYSLNGFARSFLIVNFFRLIIILIMCFCSANGRDSG